MIDSKPSRRDFLRAAAAIAAAPAIGLDLASGPDYSAVQLVATGEITITAPPGWRLVYEHIRTYAISGGEFERESVKEFETPAGRVVRCETTQPFNFAVPPGKLPAIDTGKLISRGW